MEKNPGSLPEGVILRSVEQWRQQACPFNHDYKLCIVSGSGFLSQPLLQSVPLFCLI